MTPEEFERIMDSGLRRPYVTTADPGYFQCGNCGEDIQPGDFIQRPRLKIKGDRTAWHYDCDNPTDHLAWAKDQAAARKNKRR